MSMHNVLASKILELRPDLKPAFDEVLAERGNRAEFVAKIRREILEAFQDNGPVGTCAISKYGLDTNAIEILGPETDIVP